MLSDLAGTDALETRGFFTGFGGRGGESLWGLPLRRVTGCSSSEKSSSSDSEEASVGEVSAESPSVGVGVVVGALEGFGDGESEMKGSSSAL